MRISDWSSDVCSSDLVVADLVHSEKLNKEVRHGTGRQCHRNPLPDTQHRGDNGPLGLSINSGPEAMQRGRCARLLREPLLHFFILGTLLFVMSEHWQGRHDPDRIVVDPAAVAQISQAYAGQFGAPPSADVLSRLIARE